MTKKIFITGVGTNIGKTFVSAVLVEALQADYWKPLQCGDLIFTDTDKVKKLVTHEQTKFFPEAKQLHYPLSPYEAALKESISPVTIQDLKKSFAESRNEYLMIEGAGGLMVPLNHKETLLDFIKECEMQVILVSKHYLGNLNHTLLTAEVLKKYDIPVMGIIFNEFNKYKDEFAREYLLKKTGFVELGLFEEEMVINQSVIFELAQFWNQSYRRIFDERYQ